MRRDERSGSELMNSATGMGREWGGTDGKSSGRWDGARGRRRRKEQMQMGQDKGGGCKIISSGR
jgi:hypothetical protein